MSDGLAGPAGRGAVAAAIANMVVSVLSEYTGRGPTKARAYLDGDLVSVLVRDTLTRGEQSLVRGGHADLVLRTREAYQATMRQDLVAGVERIMDRQVIAFFSSNHIEPDMGLESFVLAPVPA
jgi:uncharacterized protein YbcI